MPETEIVKKSKLDLDPRNRIQKPAPKPVLRVHRPRQDGMAGQYLNLGAGYQIAHKPNSAYSVFYSIVAALGHFEEIAKALESGKYTESNLRNIDTATEFLNKLLVPISRLEDACRIDPSWKVYAAKKTDILKTKIKSGDKQARGILGNQNRCEDGTWRGNIAEMISTCVGYYNHLIENDPKFKKFIRSKRSGPNKNVMKFKEARVVFRRYPLNKNGDKAFVLMFPKKFIDEVKQAIKTVYAVDEDAALLARLRE